MLGCGTVSYEKIAYVGWYYDIESRQHKMVSHAFYSSLISFPFFFFFTAQVILLDHSQNYNGH
jgi:hypothetical protein